MGWVAAVIALGFIFFLATPRRQRRNTAPVRGVWYWIGQFLWVLAAVVLVGSLALGAAALLFWGF